jgi:[protein-PII] uridylyltransferase
LFSKVAGTLALHGLDVLDAAVTSVDGWALETFRVESSFGPTFSWDKVLAELERVLAGRLALQARLAERVRTYASRTPVSAPIAPRVEIDNGASDAATVVEVHAADAIGVLYRITRALSELELDITSAKVATLGAQVVDSFYVRDSTGAKVEDPAVLVEIERALLHELAQT